MNKLIYLYICSYKEAYSTYSLRWKHISLLEIIKTVRLLKSEYYIVPTTQHKKEVTYTDKLVRTFVTSY